MWGKISFPGHSEICLPHKCVSSVNASVMFFLVWAKGVSHWGTTGEIIILVLITIRQVGPRFLNSLFCKIPGNAKKSYEHSKSFLFISNSTFRCFRNLLGLGASSCGFIPSEKHVIVIGSLQCLFVFPKPHSSFFWHLAVIIFVMPLVQSICNNLLCSASGLLANIGVKSAFGQVSVCSSSCASQVASPILRMFSGLFGFQTSLVFSHCITYA